VEVLPIFLVIKTEHKNNQQKKKRKEIMRETLKGSGAISQGGKLSMAPLEKKPKTVRHISKGGGLLELHPTQKRNGGGGSAKVPGGAV